MFRHCTKILKTEIEWYYDIHTNQLWSREAQYVKFAIEDTFHKFGHNFLVTFNYEALKLVMPLLCVYIRTIIMCIAQNFTKEDYYKRSPFDNLIDNECIVGEKEIFECKIANLFCLNGEEHERYISVSLSREYYE